MNDIQHLRELPLSERIQLVEDLWDTVAAEPRGFRLSSAQIAELDRRLDSPQTEGTDWDSLKRRIEATL